VGVIKDMFHHARQLHGPDIFLARGHKIRLMLTGGGGDYSVALNKSNCQVYISIYREERGLATIEEVCIQEKELKNLNFNVKSNNYMVRSYIATESKSQGGYLAIEADKNGYLLEGSVATVAVLLSNGDFIVPPFDRILPGTTAIKILDYLQQEVLTSQALPLGYLTRIVRREITVAEAHSDAVEVMFLGGEECVPVLEWDGQQVGQGVKGPAATLFQEYLKSFSKDDDKQEGQIKVIYK
jgi:branched-subunit amino acid aminotransferase/4-amino-4-deoxychorismate lyase